MNDSIYELWFSDEDGYSFFESTNDAARKLVGPSAKLIWRVSAPNFYAAQALKHEYLGWEPYVAPDDPPNI